MAEQMVVLLRDETVTASDVRPLLRGLSVTAGSLVPVASARDERMGDADARERELIYRALLELRMEMRELKEQVGRLRPGVAVPREVVERSGLASEGQRGFVILRDASGHGDYASLVEDVPYEIASDEAMFAPPPSANAPNGSGEPGGHDEEDAHDEEAPLPTLEDAERQLITEALRRFDSNRRQTAKALGISERTLYRKIKELDEDL
ncbi:MAG: helix-turn-helix domain-containing protein [Rhodothermales bacterium]